MMKYMKKPIVIEANQWFSLDDDIPGVDAFEDGDDSLCQSCCHQLDEHGQIDTLEGVHIVCPGDYIITGIQGEKYPCKPDIFDASYDRVDDE